MSELTSSKGDVEELGVPTKGQQEESLDSLNPQEIKLAA